MGRLLNRKAQFSIIAALLAAVILISTVMITYSTIRNTPVHYEPKELGAIDETNLALKQILGFTLGYYCSVLQITGNQTYARSLATSYLQSGLEYVSKIHPEWGTSFRIDNKRDLNLSINWFMSKTYSMGNLTISYDFTGLRIYGLGYEASCKLALYVERSSYSDKAWIRVIKDENEPLINLGKKNFKFYKYNYMNYTWQLTNPSKGITSFANGTYLIDLPSGMDSSSYLVQVEDQRGIVAVASSYNKYKLKLAWNSLSVETKYAVAGSVPQILGTPDGNFTTIGKGRTCEVTNYQAGTGTIEKVYFNITYYGTVSGTLGWYYKLDAGSYVKIEDLPQGGSVAAPLKRTYNATSLRASWTWSNLNSTLIHFKNEDTGSPEDANVDAIYLTVIVKSSKIYSTLKNATVVIELLQDGTARWLGQKLESTSQVTPFPPLPIKAIHVNQTRNSVSSEVPFQVEDWEADYRVPVGLTSNASIFNSRTMLVFLVDKNVSEITIWWNGRDTATQTPYAYINRYFTGDNPGTGLLTNGILSLKFGGGFILNSTLGSSSCVATFMRINNQSSTYGASPAYVIHHGIVRDIVQQEAEWSGGANNCPNLYSHIVITLPAKANYYTYRFRLMFTQSQQSRSISDLCLIQLKATANQSKWGPDWIKTLTENGMAVGSPLVSNNTGFFYNASNVWQHHWSEFIENNHGFGAMLTTVGNTQLYVFDKIAGDKTGGIGTTDTRVGSDQTIKMEIRPVSRTTTSFQYELDTIWYGATILFDGDKSIYPDIGGTTGLWMIADYPPEAIVATAS